MAFFTAPLHLHVALRSPKHSQHHVPISRHTSCRDLSVQPGPGSAASTSCCSQLLVGMQPLCSWSERSAGAVLSSSGPHRFLCGHKSAQQQLHRERGGLVVAQQPGDDEQLCVTTAERWCFHPHRRPCEYSYVSIPPTPQGCAPSIIQVMNEKSSGRAAHESISQGVHQCVLFPSRGSLQCCPKSSQPDPVLPKGSRINRQIRCTQHKDIKPERSRLNQGH